MVGGAILANQLPALGDFYVSAHHSTDWRAHYLSYGTHSRLVTVQTDHLVHGNDFSGHDPAPDSAMIIAGTGHRPDKLGGYGAQMYLHVLQIATEYLAETKPELVISGMAQGWDMALAQAAIRFEIPFHAYVPFIGQEQVWPQATRLYYQELLKRADKVKVCSEGGFSTKAMIIRNQAMVDDCDHLVALWNGSPGGTCNCIRYAAKVGRSCTNLWDKYESRTQTKEEETDR